MKAFIISLLFNAVLLGIIAFDPDGASYGTQLLGDAVPNYLIVIADFLGNLTWVLGLLFLIGSIVILIVAVSDELLKKEAETAKANPKLWKVWGKRQWYQANLMGLSIIGAVFALGSGFWFLGITWALMIVVTTAYTKEKETLRAKLDAEELLAE